MPGFIYLGIPMLLAAAIMAYRMPPSRQRALGLTSYIGVMATWLSAFVTQMKDNGTLMSAAMLTSLIVLVWQCHPSQSYVERYDKVVNVFAALTPITTSSEQPGRRAIVRPRWLCHDIMPS